MIPEQDEYDYTFTLLNIKIKHKQPVQMAVTNRRYHLYLHATPIEGIYIFNQRFTIRQGRQKKQHIDLLVNFFHQHKNAYIAGVIVLNRFQLKASEKILKIKLSNCLDEHAYCELKVNHIAAVEKMTLRKRGESMVLEGEHHFGEHLFGNKSSIGVSGSNEYTRDGGWLSDYKSACDHSERFPLIDDPQAELKKQLTRYKFQLEAERLKVKELSVKVEILELEREEEKESKLLLESQYQDWEVQKHYLQAALRRSEAENRRANQIYLKEIEELKKMMIELKEGKKEEEDAYFVSINGQKTEKLQSPIQKIPKENNFWKKKAVTFEHALHVEPILRKNMSEITSKDSSLNFNPEK